MMSGPIASVFFRPVLISLFHGLNVQLVVEVGWPFEISAKSPYFCCMIF